MKYAILTILLTIQLNIFGQNVKCGCDTFIEESKYKCDTMYFSDGAMLYWQYDCDSTWLTFENKEKIILKTCEAESVFGCNRTGLNFIKEYNNYLFFIHEWISGCCVSPDLVFLSKENGQEIKRVKSEYFIWGSIDDDFALYFSDSTYMDLVYLNQINLEETHIKFKDEEVNQSINENNINQLSDLFKDVKKEENQIVFKFKNREGDIEEFKFKISE